MSTFSFAKYLMWKDLSDRTEALKKSPFVRHMIDTPRDPYGNSASFLDPTEIDQEIQPGDLFMPLNADSSQIVAVHASAQDGVSVGAHRVTIERRDVAVPDAAQLGPPLGGGGLLRRVEHAGDRVQRERAREN